MTQPQRSTPVFAFSGRVQNRLRRDFSRWFARNTVELTPGTPIISFTFDDFPHSAWTEGGKILKQHGATATYYVSLGLVDSDTPCGRAFEHADLPQVLAAGHELGCHTYAHCHSWDTTPAVFEKSAIANQKAIEALVPGYRFQSLSYPISCARPATKRRCQRHYACCRAGGQTFNSGATDLNALQAFFLEQSRDNPQAIRDAIDGNRRAGGWLIFATHDVCEQPTRFGVTPSLFEEVVDYAAKSGAALLPVAKAWDTIRSRAPKAR